VLQTLSLAPEVSTRGTSSLCFWVPGGPSSHSQAELTKSICHITRITKILST
jgi:hypothetical protein